MDPLSIIASTITVLGACISVSEGVINLISHIQNTPYELLQTSNDVTDFRFVLSNIEESIRQEETLIQLQRQTWGLGQHTITNHVPAATPEATTLIQRAQRKLVEIDEVVRKYNHSQNAKGLGSLRRVRTLNMGSLRVLRDDLRSMKLNIATYFSVKGSTCALRSALLVTALSEEVSKDVRENESQGKVLVNVHHQVSQLNTIGGELRRSNDLIQASVLRLLHEPGLQNIQGAPTDSNSVTTADSPPDGLVDYDSSVFKLDISRFRKKGCRPFCSCICHRRYRRRPSTLMNKLLGSIFLGYSSVPFFGVKCDDSACNRPSKFSATFTYYFPSWFVIKHMFSLVLMTTPLGDPGGVLKIRKIQYTDFSIFRMASIGDCKGIKSLLDRRIVHPSTTWWGGWSPLHYAISNGQASVCKYLLSRNADPLLEDGDNQQSALEYAWTKILGKGFAPTSLVEFQSIFTDRECLEELGLTTLHKIILGLHGANLITEIATNKDALNSTDNEGRTPLSWAAQRGDLETLSVLLAHGADPHLSSRSRTAPLHFAVQAGNSSCIVPLLNAGADPNAQDHRLHTPLHLACVFTDSLQYIRPLVLNGADVKAMTDYDYSPLIIAAYKNHDSTVRYLLDKGANMNTRGQYGKTALIFAVEYNAHDVLRLLLESDADCKPRVGVKCPTIAQIAAKYADVQTLRILAEYIRAEFNLEDLEAEDDDGYVLEELVKSRIREDDAEEGFRESFQALLERMVPADLGDDEVWEDAVEMQELSDGH